MMFRVINGDRVYEEERPKVDTMTLFQVSWDFAHQFEIDPSAALMILRRHLTEVPVKSQPHRFPELQS